MLGLTVSSKLFHGRVRDRIAAEDHETFLVKAAKARWKKRISADAIERILRLTLCHPYYVNVLCGRVWSARRPPTVDAIDTAWAQYVEEDKRRVAARVLELSPTQRAMLAGLAREPTPHPTGQVFLRKLRLATSTGLRAKAVLERDDLIQQSQDGLWELVDPVLAAYLRAL